MPRPLKVFLCHAHSDKDAVKILYGRLKREGVDVWLDKEKLLPGADWEYEIRKAVRESDVVIVCLSKQFNQAGFRQKEVRIALEEADRKPEGEIFIIPARLEECDNLENLSKWHWVDLFESDGFQRLIRALRVRADKIGAALRQRGATLPRQKDNAEQQDAEKERIEQARRDAEEQERQRLAKEQSDREAAEKAENERVVREAEEKAERERLAREKAALEEAERETAARLTREKEERETAEKAARDKAEREKGERETAERLAREKEERDAAQKAERERLEKQKLKPQEPVLQPAPVMIKESNSAEPPPPKTNLRRLGIGGIIFVGLLLAIFGGNYIFNSISSTATISITKTLTPAPTKTFTPAPPTLTPTPELGIGSTQVSEKDGMVMVYIPAGKFTMGSDTNSDEQPIHQVDLDAFWIDQTEVTNAMYARCVTDGECELPNNTSRYDDPGYENHPVVYVNWFQAQTYCKWRGASLPTEAEWEKAARGTDGRTYPWGEGINCDKANYSGCIGSTSPVGSYPIGASIYGALDMAGNVWEWVNSLYQDYPYSAADGREDLSANGSRVLRGGSWFSNNVARSAYRIRFVPTVTYDVVGFRCSLSHP